MFTSTQRLSVLFACASILFSTSSHAAITETFKLTAPVEFSEEGTYLTTNKGDFALQTLTINPRVLNTMQTLKRGNCFAATSAQGLKNTDGGDISKVSKIACSNSPAAVTETFKLTAPTEYSEEGTYLTTNKGNFVLQTFIIDPRVFKNIEALKSGNCFSVTSPRGLKSAEGSDISKVSKIACKR